MSGRGNGPVDEDDLDLSNPVFRNGNSAGRSNGGGIAEVRGSGVAGVAGGENGHRQQQQEQQQEQQHAVNAQRQQQAPAQQQKRPRKSRGSTSTGNPAPYDFMQTLTEPPTEVPLRRVKPTPCF